MGSYFPIVDFERLAKSKTGGLVFLPGSPGNFFSSLQDREQLIGKILPLKCEDVFEWRGPFCVASHKYYNLYDIVFPFGKQITWEQIQQLRSWASQGNAIWIDDYILMPREPKRMVYDIKDDFDVLYSDVETYFDI